MLEGHNDGRNKFLKKTGLPDNWVLVDQLLLKAIEGYRHIKHEVNGQSQVIFLDHIIRLTICRAFVNQQNRKFVTAQKLLLLAENLINKVLQSNDYFCRLIVNNNLTPEDYRVRQEAPIIPADILQQKLYFKFGLLKIMFGQVEEAKEYFLKSCNIGVLYDARVRQKCL